MNFVSLLNTIEGITLPEPISGLHPLLLLFTQIFGGLVSLSLRFLFCFFCWKLFLCHLDLFYENVFESVYYVSCFLHSNSNPISCYCLHFFRVIRPTNIFPLLFKTFMQAHGILHETSCFISLNKIGAFKSQILYLIKFWLLHFLLFFGCILSHIKCYYAQIMPLETNRKCCQNFVKVLDLRNKY